jgi:hypothetical protein
MKFYNLELYDETYKVAPIKHTYAINNTLAVELVTDTDETFAVITVCLPEANTILELPKEAAFINTDANPWVIDFIKENNLGEIIPIKWRNGYCKYPLCLFNLNKLTQYCHDNIYNHDTINGGNHYE